MNVKTAIAFSLLVLMIPALSVAQDLKKKAPVEIEASKQLEWLRDQNKYRATGDVVITQGDTVIKGDNAEAEYDPAVGPSALTVFTVIGNVVMTSADRTIHADKGVYDTRTELLTLTGSNVILQSATATVTAQNGITYNAATGQAVATGRAHISETTKDLKADRITAWLSKGSNKLDRAQANGNVIITNKGKDGTNIAQADNAEYDAVKNIITLNGNVKLTSGPNHMQGDRAIVNLTTGVSSLQNSGTSTGRVRAIFSSSDSASPMPHVTSTVPMVKTKKAFEKPYVVGQ